jgi:hypothetical protein
MASRLKEQLEAARLETSTWPAWRKMEIEAEVLKTPLRDKSGSATTDGETQRETARRKR